MRLLLLFLFSLLTVLPAQAALVAGRPVAADEVRLTIYGEADLTLVQERLRLALVPGLNRFAFSWQESLIDPTSLQVQLAAKDARLQAVVFPPASTGQALLLVEAAKAGTVTADLRYLVSGFAWNAQYQGALAADGEALQLSGWLSLVNGSGQDLTGARIRLLLGTLPLLDQIAQLAQRQPPYGRPDEAAPAQPRRRRFEAPAAAKMLADGMALMESAPAAPPLQHAEASVFHLYALPGRWDLPRGQLRQIPFVQAPKVAVRQVWRQDDARYGTELVRLLQLRLGQAQGVPEGPLPEGSFVLWNAQGGLEGRARLAYTAVGDRTELLLGPDPQVYLRRRLMEQGRRDFVFDRFNLTGWDDLQLWRYELINQRPQPVAVAVRQHLPTAAYLLEPLPDGPQVQPVDADTLEYQLTLAAGARQSWSPRLILHQGSRATPAQR